MVSWELWIQEVSNLYLSNHPGRSIIIWFVVILMIISILSQVHEVVFVKPPWIFFFNGCGWTVLLLFLPVLAVVLLVVEFIVESSWISLWKGFQKWECANEASFSHQHYPSGQWSRYVFIFRWQCKTKTQDKLVHMFEYVLSYMHNRCILYI